MKYPIAIEYGDENTAYGVVVPDLPGCFSAADSLDEAYAMAQEAIELWINAALDAGKSIPPASSMQKHANDPEYAGWAWGVVDVDLSNFEDTVERINITLPRRVLRQIDRYVEKHHGTRSGFIAASALKAVHADDKHARGCV